MLKPKFMNAPTPPSTVYNLLILDESGSMDVVRQTTLSGFNELVQTVQGLAREFPEKKQVVTLTTFNGLGINEKLFMQEASALQQLTLADYKPDSMCEQAAQYIDCHRRHQRPGTGDSAY